MMVDRREVIAGLAALGASPALARQRHEEGHANVPGGRIWWMKVGGGSKPPLLLLHGGPGMGHDYLLPLAALGDERPVIFYDQLGCGRADSPADEGLYVIPRSVNEVDAVRRALKLERITLFGHSWGSMLAIEYMCQGRGKGVEKLVLAGALASAQQVLAGMRRLLLELPDGAGERVIALDREGKGTTAEYQTLAGQFYDRHFCRRKPMPVELKATMKNLSTSIAYRVMNGPNEFTMIGTIKDWDRRHDLSRIKVPTLITHGEFDEVTPDCIDTLHRGIQGSRVVQFPNCSHQSMNEKPVEYVRTLRRFLDQA